MSIKGALINESGTPDEEIKAKCLDFAQKQYETSKDAIRNRGQNSKDTIISQIKKGKIVESIVEKWGDKMGFDFAQRADFTIYPPHEKKFDSDIIFEGEKACKHFHITKKDPSQDQVRVSCKSSLYRIGDKFTEYLDGTRIPCRLGRQYSFTYQLSNLQGGGGQDQGKYDVYMFGIYDRDFWSNPKYKDRCVLYAWVRADLVPKMLIRPFAPHLKTTKAVVMKETCGGYKHFPCGIKELLDDGYTPKEPI